MSPVGRRADPLPPRASGGDSLTLRRATTVVGVGAIGTLLAQRAAAAGDDVVGAGPRVPAALRVVDADGHGADGTIRTAIDPATLTPAECCVVATKAHQTADAAPWLRAAIDEQTLVIVLQNGLEQVERVKRQVRAQRIVAPVVEAPAERIAPGCVRLRASPHLHFDRRATSVEAAAHCVRWRIDASCSGLYDHARWAKCIQNAVVGGVTALSGAPVGILRESCVAGLIARLVDEATAVAAAEGVVIDTGLAECLRAMAAHTPDARPSIARDALDGRRLEHDARNAVMMRRGRSAGIPTPAHERLWAGLAALDAGRITPSRAALDAVIS